MAEASTGDKYTLPYRVERLEQDVHELKVTVTDLRLSRAKLIGFWLGGNAVLAAAVWFFSTGMR